MTDAPTYRYEAQRRADARKKAATTRRQARDLAGLAAGAPGDVMAVTITIDTLAGCVSLVAAAMAEAVGGPVGEADDLFDAGLSSVSATRLREELAMRTGLTLPREMIYDHTTVRSLAAAVFRIRCASVGVSTPAGAGGDVELLTAEAKSLFREGALDSALATCWRALGGPPLPAGALRDELPPVLSVLAGTQARLGQWQEAADALDLLLAASSGGAESSGSNDAGDTVDQGLLWAMLARHRARLGDAPAAVAATERARTAAVPATNGAGVEAATGRDEAAGGRALVQRGLRLSVVPALGDPGLHCGLRVLDLSDNHLTALPEALGLLSGLTELVVAQNQLVTLPECLAALPHLGVLSLQANCLPQLPAVVLRCGRLRTLRWGFQTQAVATSDSVLEAAQACDQMPACTLSPELRVLELEGNGVTELPPLHPDNMVLTAVLAAFNRLSAIPGALAQCGDSLKILNLGCNRLAGSNLTSVLQQLTHLTCLRLECNGLIQLPGAAIDALVHLRELAVYGNELQTLPEELGSCAALEMLDAHHNHLTTLPMGAVGPGSTQPGAEPLRSAHTIHISA